MPVRIVVGAQWGDEGKGKIVDVLAERAHVVARYQGGANAGHTVIVSGREFVLHQIPSGIFHPHVTCVIGNGVVLDPAALLEEIDRLRGLGIDISGRLLVSRGAHLILPYHKALDALREQSEDRIGTTGRGIGPAYIDKAMRTGIRVGDLLDPGRFSAKLDKNVKQNNVILRGMKGGREIDAAAVAEEYSGYGARIREYAADTATYLCGAVREGKEILAEGAQGALLDVDHGTYPFVTSSNPTSGGACTGLGIPPTAVTSVLGVVKAYATRVGNGPFPTEIPGDEGRVLRETGGEYGATTGRPRRCGWLDAVSLRYSIMVNGVSSIAVTKLDVLDGFGEIRICTGYRSAGSCVSAFPPDASALASVTPEYETFGGWKSPTSGARSIADLPAAARRYLDAVGSLTGASVGIVSVGARREQTLFA